MLKVSDNSGAIYVKCIRLLNMSIKTGALPGQTLTVVVKKNIIKKNIKKSKEIKNGQVCIGLILRNAMGIKRWGHFFFKARHNCVAIINKFSLPYGSRILGPVFRELRDSSKKYKKVLSISQFII